MLKLSKSDINKIINILSLIFYDEYLSKQNEINYTIIELDDVLKMDCVQRLKHFNEFSDEELKDKHVIVEMVREALPNIDVFLTEDEERILVIS